MKATSGSILLLALVGGLFLPGCACCRDDGPTTTARTTYFGTLHVENDKFLFKSVVTLPATNTWEAGQGLDSVLDYLSREGWELQLHTGLPYANATGGIEEDKGTLIFSKDF